MFSVDVDRVRQQRVCEAWYRKRYVKLPVAHQEPRPDKSLDIRRVGDRIEVSVNRDAVFGR
jgi:hypothetical protein